MTKTEARKLAKACRAAVDLHTVGHAMAGVLFTLPAWQHADTVLAFASMPDEPDTADILRQALAEGKRLLLPRVQSRTEMDWVEITALSQLQPGAYGILEAPASLPAFDTAHLGDGALALIPCLAASPDGVRLGRGGGIMTASLHIIKAGGCWFAPQPPCWATCLARAGTSDFLPMKY